MTLPPWIGAATTKLTNVSLPNGPGGLVVDPASGTIFVAGGISGPSGNLTVVSNGSVMAVRSLPGLPGGMALDPVRGWLYVALLTNASVLVLAAGSGAPVATIPVMDRPQAVAWDPSNGLVYVANETGGRVAVINGTSLLTNISTRYSGPGYEGGWFGGIACDPTTGLVYVTGLLQHSIGVLNGTSFLTNLSLPSALDPQDIAYNPSDGLVYATMHDGPVIEISGTQWAAVTGPNLSAEDVAVNLGNGLAYVDNMTGAPNEGISAVHGSAWVTPGISIGEACGALTFEAPTDQMIATCGLSDLVFISTSVTEQPLILTPVSAPPNSVDLGGQVELAGSVLAPGMNWSYAALAVTPSGALVCTTGGGVSWNASAVWVSVGCTAAAPGPAQIQLSAGNPLGYAFNWTVPITVFPDPTVGPPILTDAAGVAAESTDVGELVYLFLNWTGGSGAAAAANWTGVPAGACSPGPAESLSCLFPTPGTVAVSVAVTDTDGGTTGTSRPLDVPVYRGPVSLTPTANRSSVDRGQYVRFDAAIENGSGAPGPVAFQWVGLPAGCASPNESSRICLPGSPGVFPVGVWATDGDEVRSAESSLLPFVVYPDPSLSIVPLTSLSLEVGASLDLNVSLQGGSGGGTVTWAGLPPGCPGSGSPIVCRVSIPGSFLASAGYTDSNGYAVRSPQIALNVVPQNVSSPSGTESPPFELLLGSAITLALVAGVILLALRRRRPGARVPASDRRAPTTVAETGQDPHWP